MQDVYIWQLEKRYTYFVINITVAHLGIGYETIYIG